MFGQFHGQSPSGLTRVIAADCRAWPQHSHSESHLALVSDSKCESEAAIAIPQLIINQRPETDDDSELPQSAEAVFPGFARLAIECPVLPALLQRALRSGGNGDSMLCRVATGSAIRRCGNTTGRAIWIPADRFQIHTRRAPRSLQERERSRAAWRYRVHASTRSRRTRPTC